MDVPLGVQVVTAPYLEGQIAQKNPFWGHE